MDILNSLGINSTIFIQFFIFIISYLILTMMVFNPYYRAYRERYDRTVGSEDLTSKLVEETQQLEAEFEENAKALNLRIKKIFDDEKKTALEKQTSMLQSATLKAEEYLKKSELELDQAKTKIHDELKKEVEPIANLIKKTVVG